MLLDGKVAVISGAASPRGIGLATARLFAAHGARVAILDLQGFDAAAAELGPAHRGYACDLTDRAACGRAVQQVLADFGGIDILINNAGIIQPLKLMDIGPAHWDAVLDVNLRGVLNLSQAAVSRLRDRQAGSIACMSSVSAQRGGGIFGGPYYSAAKAGVLGLAKAMARELGPDGIRVNCVTPGLMNIVTLELRQAILDQRADEARLDAGLKATLQGKGMTFLPADKDAFRAALKASSFYADWRARFGDPAWAALQSVSGDLA